MNKKEVVVIGMGSNLGDRLRSLQEAIDLLARVMTHIRPSSIIESAAYLLPGSPLEWDLPYLNCAVAGFTHLSPCELLHELKAIEQQMHSYKIARWAPRKIDLDILAYGERVVQEEDLSIPHKELLVRPFALFPLGQLLPYWKYPVKGSPAFGKTAVELTHASSLAFDRILLAAPKLVGILNITPDSFSDGGLFLEKEQAITHLQNLWKAGASFIDLGAAATRPGSYQISSEEEWSRLEPVLAALQEFSTLPRISIDTYHPSTAIKAIAQFDVAMINFEGDDIGEELAKIIEEKEKLLVCMHALSLPPDRVRVMSYEIDPLESLCSWAEAKIERLKQLGVNKKRIILDPGIGFGKTAAQSLIILKRIKELKKIGAPLLVGHSRKSFMRLFSSHAPADRDWQSAALAVHLMEAEVDYLRIHDVGKHMELLAAHQSLSIGAQHAFA